MFDLKNYEPNDLDQYKSNPTLNSNKYSDDQLWCRFRMSFNGIACIIPCNRYQKNNNTTCQYKINFLIRTILRNI